MDPTEEIDKLKARHREEFDAHHRERCQLKQQVKELSKKCDSLEAANAEFGVLAVERTRAEHLVQYLADALYKANVDYNHLREKHEQLKKEHVLKSDAYNALRVEHEKCKQCANLRGEQHCFELEMQLLQREKEIDDLESKYQHLLVQQTHPIQPPTLDRESIEAQFAEFEKKFDAMRVQFGQFHTLAPKD